MEQLINEGRVEIMENNEEYDGDSGGIKVRSWGNDDEVMEELVH